MPQTSIYLDDATAFVVRDEAKRKGVSLSKFVGRILNDYANGPRDAWPAGYWDGAYGCLASSDAGNEASGDSCLDPALDDACDWWAD